MTDCARVLEALRRGPQSAAALYGLHCIAHSRIADLRRQGHVIGCRRLPGVKGAASYVYTLHFDAGDAPLSEPGGLRGPQDGSTAAPAAIRKDAARPGSLSGEQLVLG